jgi:hypothetical protein
MAHARRWLPVQAWVDGVIEARIRAQMETWMESWISPYLPDKLSIYRYDIVHPLQQTDRFEGLNGHLLLIMDDDTLVQLGLEILGVIASPESLNAHDKLLLSRLAHKAVTALCEQFEQTFGPAVTGASSDKLLNVPQTPFVFTVNISTDISMLMGFSHRLATWLRLSELPEDAIIGKLHATRCAVRSAPANITAYFGTVEAEIDELRKLGVGDVIVLDRTVDDAVDIIIDETGIQAACARLSQSKAGLELVLMEPKSGGNAI